MLEYVCHFEPQADIPPTFRGQLIHWSAAFTIFERHISPNFFFLSFFFLSLSPSVSRLRIDAPHHAESGGSRKET
jgi:hypothetical protein